jgi:hypothetical protein
MELDEAIGELPSLAESFAAQSGCALHTFLCAPQPQKHGGNRNPSTEPGQ